MGAGGRGFCALIILHEFGHFVVAKATGMRVERFFCSSRRSSSASGVGRPSTGSECSLGGFVKITGMNPGGARGRGTRRAPQQARAPGANRGGRLRVRTPESIEGTEPLPPDVLKRLQPAGLEAIAVISAGPAMNILVAFVVLFFLALGTEATLEVGSIEQGTPAEHALKPGDQIISVDGVRPTNGGPDRRTASSRIALTRLQVQVNTHTCSGTPVDNCRATTPAVFVVQRDGKLVTVRGTPCYDANAPPLKEGDPPGRYKWASAFWGAGWFRRTSRCLRPLAVRPASCGK